MESQKTVAALLLGGNIQSTCSWNIIYFMQKVNSGPFKNKQLKSL